MSEPLPPIQTRLVVDVPAAHLWTIMTGADTVPLWLGCLGYAPTVGHTFYMQPDPAKRAAGDVSGATHCDVVALDAPNHFAFSWYMPGTPKTEVSLRLSVLDTARTEVILTHSGWEQFPAEMVRAIRDGLEGGWSSAVLPGLKALAIARNI